ncbi:ComEC/Rec2 family competence protein [Shewanella baltica]|uniref:ComEC/Rec2 family competence protein n=1 Tax=Shewanella baltica TaxID=62322 RepID=UPI003D7A6F56
MTHIDEDHILGAIPLIESTPDIFTIGNVYFNSPALLEFKRKSGNISVKQAIKVESLIVDKKIELHGLESGQIFKPNKNIEIQVLSPRKSDLDLLDHSHLNKDSSVTKISNNTKLENVEVLSKGKDNFLKISSDLVNACSIAFILRYKEKSILYLADAHPEIIAENIESLGYSSSNKLKIDIVKLSHHGSFKNISDRFISLISCNTYWISTNGGKGVSKHPDPATLAKLTVNMNRSKNESITFLFNYPIKQIECKNGCLMSENDKREYNVVFKEEHEVIWS